MLCSTDWLAVAPVLTQPCIPRAQVPRGGYSIGAVEQLLKACHLMLWPQMLRHSAGEPSVVGDAFLAGWVAFLAALQKHVKSNEPEDKALQVGAAAAGALSSSLRPAYVFWCQASGA